jgi:hypothetical protein
MALRVVSFATYLVRVDAVWRDGDYNALKFVKAIKGLPVNMYARVPVCGVIHRLEQSNAEEAIGWIFGDWLQQILHPKESPQLVSNQILEVVIRVALWVEIKNQFVK